MKALLTRLREQGLPTDRRYLFVIGRASYFRVWQSGSTSKQRRLPNDDSIEEFTTEEFDRTFKTNVYAMFWLCRAALAKMRPGSAIINTASIQAFDPSPNLLAYAATKGAIVNFTKGLSKIAMKKGYGKSKHRLTALESDMRT